MPPRYSKAKLVKIEEREPIIKEGELLKYRCGFGRGGSKT